MTPLHPMTWQSPVVTGPWYDVVEPATDAVLTLVRSAGPSDVTASVARAAVAQTPPTVRRARGRPGTQPTDGG
ncbi:hypothetical protein ACWD6I_11545 [Streptomyces sp. NPDC002454]